MTVQAPGMPWQEHRTVELREQLVLAAMAPGASVSELCSQAKVSRKTAYKWIARFKAQGRPGLADASRRPLVAPGTSGEVVIQLANLRTKYPRWGPKKLRVLLLKEGVEGVPSVKTIGRILERLGEPKLRVFRHRRVPTRRRPVRLAASKPNEVWTVDFKGWWRTKDGRRCEPLTVRDAFSRYVLCLQLMRTTKGAAVKKAFEGIFARHGLPGVIHVDNGAPFACTHAPGGLSRLSAWWVSLGIRVSFSRPGCPQDNGGHERMHADVSAELEQDSARSIPAQQVFADAWRDEFNNVRPHEALGMKTPADFYVRSLRAYRGLRAFRYPGALQVRRVDRIGAVRFEGKRLFISSSLSGHDVALRRANQGRVAVHFYELKLGLFDLDNAPEHHPAWPLRIRQRAA